MELYLLWDINTVVSKKSFLEAKLPIGNLQFQNLANLVGNVFKIVTICWWGTIRDSQIFIIFATDPALTKMFIWVKFE